jgi:hypothetical protein
MLIELLSQHITVHFSPRGIVDFCHDGLHLTAFPVEAVKETDGIEAVTKVSQVCEKADGSFRALSQSAFHQISYSPIHGNPGISKVVSPPEVCDVDAVTRPQPPSFEKPGQLIEIQVQHEKPVLEPVDHGIKTAMAHPTLI